MFGGDMISWASNFIKRNLKPITDLNEVSSNWLTQTLTKNGHLKQGKVLKISSKVWKRTSRSILARVKVEYSPDTITSSPNNLLLKFTIPNDISTGSPSLPQREYEFYKFIGHNTNNLPIVNCYDVVYSAPLGKAHFLLEDLSRTHFRPEYPLPPSKLQCEQSVDCLANWHAHWWNDSRLGNEIGTLPTDEHIQNQALQAEKLTSQFLSFLKDRVSSKRCKIYHDLCAYLPTLLRDQRNENLTLIHGDAHCWNFLSPRPQSEATCRIIDWESWRVDVGTYDLALMIAVHWSSERRAFLEESLVRRYYLALVAYGIRNFEWDDCWRSYRLSVLRHLLSPVYQWAAHQAPFAWWPNLERILLAFDDLKCYEFL